MIILNTNVRSGLMQPKPFPQVAAWVAKHVATELATTSITEAEIPYGIQILMNVSVEMVCLRLQKLCSLKILGGEYSPSTATPHERFQRLKLIAERSANPSVTLMPRSPLLPKRAGPNARRAMRWILQSAGWLLLIPGTTCEPPQQ
jgi:hypothetical protein